MITEDEKQDAYLERLEEEKKRDMEQDTDRILFYIDIAIQSTKRLADVQETITEELERHDKLIVGSYHLQINWYVEDVDYAADFELVNIVLFVIEDYSWAGRMLSLNVTFEDVDWEQEGATEHVEITAIAVG